jgi:hypothetical protein
VIITSTLGWDIAAFNRFPLYHQNRSKKDDLFRLLGQQNGDYITNTNLKIEEMCRRTTTLACFEVHIRDNWIIKPI